MKAANKETILVVDDVQANVELLLGVLSPEYEVAVALSGERALRVAAALKPSLVLLDVKMPGMDGYELLRRLRAHGENRETPVIFLSADSSHEGESEGLRQGAVDYISKPINPDLVRRRVRTHLELRRHRARQREQWETGMLRGLEALATRQRPALRNARIRQMVLLLASELSRQASWMSVLTGDYMEALGLAAPLHDIGMLMVPEAILAKRGSWQDWEAETMRRHACAGQDLLSQVDRQLEGVPVLEVAAQLAASHHERWDGAGYPVGLKGKNIPHAARILAVADAYDSLVEERSYKPKRAHNEAVAIIEGEKGCHFDPDVVDAFAAVADRIEILYSGSRA